jgi:hypothetical protein
MDADAIFWYLMNASWIFLLAWVLLLLLSFANVFRHDP